MLSARSSRRLLLAPLCVMLLASGCSLSPVADPVSPIDVPGAAEVVVSPAADYVGTEGEACYPLAYVGPEGSVSVRMCWHGAASVVGKGLAQCGLAWYAVSAGDGLSDLWLAFVQPDSKVAVYKSEGEELQPLPVSCGLDETVHYDPDGFMALDSRKDDAGFLRILSPWNGAPVLDVTYYHSWSPCSGGLYVALGLPRNTVGAVTSDLVLVDLSDGTRRVLQKGNRHSHYAPIGWLTAELLAYQDVENPRETLYLDISTGEAPPEEPPLPLAFDTLRAAGLIPQNLKTAWTGQYSVSPNEAFMAITVDVDGTPTVFVGRLASGDWYEVGPGECPVWATRPSESGCGCEGSGYSVESGG